MSGAPQVADKSRAGKPAPPRRRLQLDLDLGADSLDDLVFALRHIADRLELDERETVTSTSGSPSSGYHLVLACDPDQNAERFRRELESWTAERRARRSPDAEGES